MTQLSAQQEAGLQKIRAWYEQSIISIVRGDRPQVFRLFGYAGTGKTTMAKHVPEALGIRDVRYGTYTGKAAHVLRMKGAAPVSTIHSGIYKPTTSLEARMALRDAQEELEYVTDEWTEATSYPGGGSPDVWGPLAARKEHLETIVIPKLKADARRVSWELNPDSDWALADLIILDEVSMVNAKLAMDIESYGVPVLVLGDPAQLPPVEGGGYYTNATPDHLLTEIHRQALDNPITSLATRVRQSTTRTLGLTGPDMIPASVSDALKADQVLCWTNKRRWSMVKAMRNALSRPEGQVVAGDRIMCLTNNKDIAVFNGQQFTVVEARRATANYSLTLIDDEGQRREIPTIGDAFLGREMQDQAKQSGAGLKGNYMLATFAQAITVHKAQGSEWDSVYVVNEIPQMLSRGGSPSELVAQARQWLYTAVTRASKELTITAPRPQR